MSKNDLVDMSKNDLVNISEVANMLNIDTKYAYDKIKALNIKVAKVGKNNKKYWKREDILVSIQQQQQQETERNKEKASRLVAKTEQAVMGEALVESFNQLDMQSQIASAFNILNIALKNTTENFAQVKSERDEFKQLLGLSKEYYSVKRISMLNNKKDKDYNWRELKRISIAKGYKIKTEYDSNYGNVNSYHIEVWKEVYPKERY